MTKDLDQILKEANDEKLAKQASIEKQASAVSNTGSLENIWVNTQLNKQASAVQDSSEEKMTPNDVQALHKMAHACVLDSFRAEALNKQANAVTPEQKLWVQRQDLNKQAAPHYAERWTDLINASNNLLQQKVAYVQNFGQQALVDWEEQQKVAQEEKSMGKLYAMAMIAGYNKEAEADVTNSNPAPQANTAALGGHGAPAQVPDDSTKEQKAKELTIAANPFNLSPAGNKKPTAGLASAAINMTGAGAGGTLGIVGGTAAKYVNPLKN